ncbi:DNA-binding protein with winged-HTH domain [Shewanella psychrophila]|uniref:DNA-binding protein with winged-HTH domain n=1 Tax=Shewanella psychrophila TaxID=225848 RepID=A0A1S6HPI7_9GAMM|nr:winged helix-turn-helix domain-containing protein [Shewanella psychrophila]AQS37412.1 DNA-binding protein with winged-HTH domain [Shewanella psychrophila]
MSDIQSLFTSPQPFQIGDSIFVDPIKHTIRLETEQKVEPQLVQLLTLLASEQGQTVSREAIFTHIWPDMVVTANSLNQSMSKLRKLLGDDSKNPHIIVTIPRQGYALIEKVTLVHSANTSKNEDKPVSIETSKVEQQTSDSPSSSVMSHSQHQTQVAKESLATGVNSKPSPFKNKNAIALLSGLLILLCLSLITTLLWLEDRTQVVVSVESVLTNNGQIPADPISHILAAFLYTGLKESLKNDPFDIHFICPEKPFEMCEQDFSYIPDEVIEVKPIIRYSPKSLQVKVLIDGEQNSFEFQSYKLSFDRLDEEFDELLLNLVEKFTDDNNRKRVISSLFEWLKRPNDPSLSIDRIKLSAYGYSQQVLNEPFVIDLLKQSAQQCDADCPIIYGSFGRVMLNQYLKTDKLDDLQQAIHFLLQGSPEYLPDTRLKLAAAYALSGEREKSHQLLKEVDKVSFIAVKKALHYYLDITHLNKASTAPFHSHKNYLATQLVSRAEQEKSKVLIRLE